MLLNKLLLGFSNNSIPNKCDIITSLEVTKLNYYDLLNTILKDSNDNISYLIYYTRTGVQQVYNLKENKQKVNFKQRYMKKMSDRMLFSADFGNKIYLNIIYDKKAEKFIFLILNMNVKFMNNESIEQHFKLNQLLDRMISQNYENIYYRDTYSYVLDLNDFKKIFDNVKLSCIEKNSDEYGNIFKPILPNPATLLFKTGGL